MNTKSQPLVELANVSVERDGRKIIDELSLTISSGDLVSILGPNGGGKTTLIKLLAGTLAVSSGEIRRRDNLRIGYQPQRSVINTYLPLNAREYLLQNTHASTEEIHAHLAGFALKESLLDQQVGSLSGGERQVLTIVRTFLRKPDLLLLDEPGTYCEHKKLSEMYAKIEDYSRSSGCATVMVSHDLSRVLQHSDHIYCINSRLVCDGGPDRIVDDLEFEKLFGEKGRFGIYQHDTHNH